MSLDKRHSNVGKNATTANFNRYDGAAVAGQTIINLPFIFTADSVVFINYAPLPEGGATGFGTKKITLVTPLNLYDIILVIG